MKQAWLILKYDPEIHSLRDVKIELLKHHRKNWMTWFIKDAGLLLEENQRLLEVVISERRMTWIDFGQTDVCLHEGLSKDYAVSCPESDFLVNAIKEMKGVKGARQMGGGFGGCIITLVEKDAADNFIQDIQEKYENKYGKIRIVL